MTKHRKRGEQETDGVQDPEMKLPNKETCGNTEEQLESMDG